MDKTVLERFLGITIILVNDENFVLHGRITKIYDNCVDFLTDGETRVLSFDRIKEIRPMRRQR